MLYGTRFSEMNNDFILFANCLKKLVFCNQTLIFMSFAGKNLRFLRKQRHLTQEEFARELGIKRSLMGAYEENRAMPKLPVLQRISDVFSLSLDDILTRDLSNDSEAPTDREPHRDFKLSENKNETNAIVFVPLHAASGYLAGLDDPDYLAGLQYFVLPILPTGLNYRAFEIVGDSMLPTVSGSIIVASRLGNPEMIKNLEKYIIVSKRDGIVYKRIQLNYKNKDVLNLISDNPTYGPYQVGVEDICEIWRAELILQSAKDNSQRYDLERLISKVETLQSELTSLKSHIALK